MTGSEVSFSISSDKEPFFFFNCMFYQLLSVQLYSCSGVVYYHLLLRRETRIPGVAPFSFRIGIWDLFVHRGQKF